MLREELEKMRGRVIVLEEEYGSEVERRVGEL
jgi:hypothetical protein